MTDPISHRDDVEGSSGASNLDENGDIDAQDGTLLSMPVDLMFEVAGHLDLRDLVALTYTSKALRGTLYARNFSAVWKARRCAAGAPKCPPRFSERRWAIFLYGPPVCERCGAEGVHRVEMYIQRRVCARCKRKYLIDTIVFPDLFPNCDPAVLDMVPYTWSGGWMPSTGTVDGYQGNFSWSSDIKRVGERWALLQNDVRARVEGAEEKAAAYRGRRVREVKRITKYANKFQYAVGVIGRESFTKVIEKRMSRFDAIRTRLLALGYDERDISYTAFCLPEFQQGAELTDESWAHIQSQVVALVESRQDARLEGERSIVRIDRIRMMHTFYLEYIESVAPQEWAHLPSIYELIEFPALKTILEAVSNVDMSPQTPFVAHLPTVISEWLSAKKARVTAMLGPRSGVVDDPLDLATSVFECTSSGCANRVSEPYARQRTRYPLISWEAIGAHSCQPVGRYTSMFHTPTSVGVSHLGGLAAAALVRGAGLDPASATIAQMDALDLRFACLECPPRYTGCQKRRGYPWKFAVEHGMTTQHAAWHKMSPSEAERTKKQEIFWGTAWTSSWSCSHCTRYLGKWGMKDRVIRHLSNVHQIRSPTEPADLFWYPSNYLTPPHSLEWTEIDEPVLADVENI